MTMTIAELQAENAALQQRVAELEQCSDMLRILLGSSSDIMLIIDRHGRYLSILTAKPELLAQPPNDLLGKTLHEVLPSAQADTFLTLIQTALHSQQPQTLEYPLKVQTGEDWFRATVSPFDQERCAFVIRHITERKQQEAEIAASQQLLRLVIDHIPQAIFWKSPALTYLGCNRLFADFAGLASPDDIVGQTDFAMPWAELAHHYREDDQRVIETHTPKIAFEEPLVDTNQRTRWLRTSKIPLHTPTGDVFAVLGVFEDITERRELEADLWLRQFALDHASDMVEFLDPTGRFVYVNEAVCKQTGYTRNELLTMPVMDIDPNVPPDQWTRIWFYLQQTGTTTIETLHRRKDGSTFPVEVTGTYLQMSGQEFALSFVRDITERKRQEAERDALQQQVIDAQRVALRELSTPLIPIADQVLVMPLIGTIDSTRAQMVLEALLTGVATHNALLVILDITGVQMVDTQVANAFIQAAQAVKLLGAQVMITGIQPPIAQTLVSLGTNLRGIITHSTLQSGIASALSMLRPGSPLSLRN